MSSAAPVLAALVAGPASIFIAAVSLAQFRWVYLLLSDLASRRSKVYLLGLLRPGTNIRHSERLHRYRLSAIQSCHFCRLEAAHEGTRSQLGVRKLFLK